LIATHSAIGWLRELLPAEFGVAGGDIDELGPSGYPQEEAAIAQAAAKRRREFRAGRIHARRALALVGAAPSAIPQGPAGEPVWPAGYTGSICHTEDLAVAVAAATTAIRAVGLDVASDAPLEASAHRFVCRPGEAEAVPALAPTDVEPAKRLLVAKEAFMKLNYALTGTVVDFLDIHIGFQIAGRGTHAFRATSFPAAAGPSEGYEGRLGWHDGRIAAIMYVRRSDDI